MGNIRLSYSQDPSTNVLKIIEENHYYPFGLKHSGYNAEQLVYTKNSSDVLRLRPVPPLFVSSFNFKYNAKAWETDLELNIYAMDMRQYDPAIGRWNVIDPVDHHGTSTYSAFENNPIYWADPSGADAENGRDDRPTSRFAHWSDSVRGVTRDEDGKAESNNSSNGNSKTANTNNSTQTDESNNNSGGNIEDPDPPRTIWEWIKSVFTWKIRTSDEYENRENNRKALNKGLDVIIKGGSVGLEGMATIMTLPVGEVTAGVEALASKGLYTVVKESVTKYSVVAESGSATAFYKVLNPAWEGAYQYTKGAFSTTSFTTETGTKVILNTLSKSTGSASVKIIEKNGIQILFRFPKL